MDELSYYNSECGQRILEERKHVGITGSGDTHYNNINVAYFFVIASISGKSAISIHNRNGERRLVDASDRQGYINIDCGATKSYQTSNMSYDSDEGYIATGSSMLIDSEFLDVEPVLHTVRSFPDGKRNCYTLKPVNGRDNNYLIRARFMYGNYDGKNSSPIFDIYIGVNFWQTIVLQSAQYKFFIEIVHKPTTDFIYICLVNTGRGTPFISELVLRPLDNSLYNVSEFTSLDTDTRYNTGVAMEYSGYTNYPDDVYDRFWAPLPRNSFQLWETYRIDKDLSSLRNDAYRVPPSIFTTGARPHAGSRSMDFFHTLKDPLVEVYFYLHFAETDQKIGNNELREFNIFINGKPITQPIRLRYLEPITVVSSPIKLEPSYSKIWLSINQTETSTLPPILNAVELYNVRELRQSSTNQDDTNAIMDVKTKYGANGLIKSWQGDPCLPKLPWDGLICNDNGNDSPRITSMNLASWSLTGDILPSLSSIKLLSYLNLSNNNLTGSIPEFLADMPSLRVIDLSGNKLGGSVPIILKERVKNGLLSLRLEGNPDLCTLDACRETSKKRKVLAPAAAAASLFVLLVAIACAVFCACRRKREQALSSRFESKGGMKSKFQKFKGGMKSKNRKFTYSEVINMTKNFQTIVGKGGFGTVYHGSLDDGTEVAVKILKQSTALSIESFQTEAELLMRVHHRNLVSLVGYCEEGMTMALIYEYMANGSLREHLSGENADILSWKQRLQIIIDAAQGLDYLHSGCKPAIVHRDMKPANILLDDKLQAKIADFGMSRIFSTESTSHISTENVAGTPGYLDPEYIVSFRLTEKSDVYSFGVIMLELITGRAAITRNDHIVHIVEWVAPLLARGDILNIVDKRLQGDISTNSAWTALEMAMACLSLTGMQRPSMSQVLVDMKECFALELTHEKAKDGASCKATTTFEILHVVRI